MADARRIGLSKLRYNWTLYLLVLPSALLVGVFMYYPAVSGVTHAFYRWDGSFIEEPVGLGNFARAVRDPLLGKSFIVVLVLVLANVFKMIPSIITAVVIHRLRDERWRYTYRVLFVVPMIIPAMVGLLIWKFFYDPSVGALNAFLDWSGLIRVLCWLDRCFDWQVFVPGRNIAWLGEPELVIPSLILWGFPWVGVVGVLIYLAGLQNISKDVYEAAALDGVGWFRTFWNIELPLIMTQVRLNLVLMIIGTFQGYGLILVLFGDTGGPGGRANVPGLYMFHQAFTRQFMGYACAIGILLFVIILTLTLINNKLVRVEK